MSTAGTPTYHDLFITTADIPRTSIFNLGYDLRVLCTHISGWELWHYPDDGRSYNVLADWELLAGEFGHPEKWLVLDVAGHVIPDSRRTEDELEQWRAEHDE